MIDLALSFVLAIATWIGPLSVFAPTPEHQPRPNNLDRQCNPDQNDRRP